MSKGLFIYSQRPFQVAVVSHFMRLAPEAQRCHLGYPATQSGKVSGLGLSPSDPELMFFPVLLHRPLVLVSQVFLSSGVRLYLSLMN